MKIKQEFLDKGKNRSELNGRDWRNYCFCEKKNLNDKNLVI